MIYVWTVCEHMCIHPNSTKQSQIQSKPHHTKPIAM